MTNAERTLKKNIKIKELDSHVKQLDLDLKQANDIIAAQINEIEELSQALKNWEKKQANGYTAIAINDDYIIDAVNVLPHSKFIYTQDIPSDIKNACYREVNGIIELDIQKYKKHRRGL